MLGILFLILAYIAFFLSCVIEYSNYYVRNVLFVNNWNQILFNLNMGMEGADDVWQTVVSQFFEMYGTALLIMLVVLIAGIVLCLWYRQRKKNAQKHLLPSRYELTSQSRMLRTFCACLMCLSLAQTMFTADSTLDSLGYYRYLENQGKDTGFFESYYMNPREVSITAPEEKKNLLTIVIESMEVTYTDKEHGGVYDVNYIPALTDIALNNTSFSDEGIMQGSECTNGTNYTAAALVGLSIGVPLTYVSNEIKEQKEWYGHSDKPYLPGAVSIGQILEENGYSNTFILGSDSEYSGRKNFFQQHGNYNILDYYAAVERGYAPEGYWVWWGVEDRIMYQMAKDELTALSQQDQPFNCLVLTADTHFPDGYCDEECEDLYGNQMKNVFTDTDRQLRSFLDWCEQQPWYEDTVIVITGDHSTMDGQVNAELKDMGVTRRGVYTAIINGPEYLNGKRDYTIMDLFPTTLGALGFTIDGNRLGLGTNMYSDSPTLSETFGLDRLNEEIDAATLFYKKNIAQVAVSEEEEAAAQKETEKEEEDAD